MNTRTPRSRPNSICGVEPTLPLRLAVASNNDREQIYRLRHAIYAAELGQPVKRPFGWSLTTT